MVHNGIIENHRSIRAFLTEQGIEPTSDTDTETLAQLIGFLYDGGGNGESGDLLAAVRRALRDVRGTFGIVVVSRDHPDQLIAARRGSPVMVGIGDGEHLVASDGAAVSRAYAPRRLPGGQRDRAADARPSARSDH